MTKLLKTIKLHYWCLAVNNLAHTEVSATPVLKGWVTDKAQISKIRSQFQFGQAMIGLKCDKIVLLFIACYDLFTISKSIHSHLREKKLVSQLVREGVRKKHCQRHNGPEGWVHITQSCTNLDKISISESWLSINFKFSTKHQYLH